MIGFIKKFFPVPAHKLKQDDIKTMVAQDAKVRLIDVRTAMEFRDGHINPCYNYDIKSPDFEKQIKNLEKDRTYVLYCRSGARSAKARKKMLSMGFDKVYELQGGITAWEGQKRVK